MCWCSYIVEFNKKTTEFMTEYKIGEKKRKSIQTIVDYFSKNPNTELPDDRDGTIIDFEEDISNDQDNVLEELKM
ncbi:unnamed protein product [Rhizophagus irregularis]|nr:unnamed protein product [Rhizophagus irregularis]